MDDIKKKLLSVLLSKAGGVPLSKIESDYRRLVSEPLEWRKFNFQSLGQFLEAIPDVVRLEIKNGEIYVYGIAGNMLYVNPTARKAQYKKPTPEPAQNHKSDSSPNMVVFIGNLPLNATIEDLRLFLSAYPFQCIRVTKKVNTSCAFVETSRTVGERMCAELNRQKYCERQLVVEASTGQRKGGLKNSDGSSKGKSPADSDVDGQAAGTAEKMNAFSAGVPVAGRGTSNGFRELKPLSVDVETAKPTSYPVNDFGGRSRSRASDSSCVGNLTHRSPLDLYLPQAVSAQINDLLSAKESQEERSKLIWDSDDEMPPLVDSRLEEYTTIDMVKYSGRKENLQPPNVNLKAREPFEENLKAREPFEENLKAREPFEKLLGANGRCNAVPRGFHSDFGSSSKPAANNHLSENRQPSNVNLKAREPVEEKPSGGNGHCDVMPSGFHSGFGSSTKPAANNHLSNLASESGQRVKKDHDGFNLYVKNIPLGVTTIELQNLFRNCMKIVPLSPRSCFAIYETMDEVLTAAEQIWTIRGSLLIVDVATRHKTADSSYQADLNNSDFKNITCTVDSELTTRKVHMSVGKCPGRDTPMPNISSEQSDDRRRQFSNCFASSNKPGDMFAANRVGNTNSLLNNLARTDNGPSRKLDKSLPLISTVGSATSAAAAAARCMSEAVSSSNDASSFKLPQMPRGSSQSLSCHGISSQKGANGNVKLNENMKMDSTFAESESTCRKMLTEARLEDVDSSRPDRSGNWLEPGPSSPSGNSLSAIPKEMRLKELLGLYKDTYPNGTLPDSLQLPDVVEIIVTMVVPEFDSSFLWGQLATDQLRPELEQIYRLCAKMAEIENTLVHVTADLRRGAAKYNDDWSRVWIKERRKSESVVFFVDYGNTETVPNESLFQLPDEFWEIRPAAVPFRIVDNSKINVVEYLNKMVTAKVKKGEQRSFQSLIVEIYNVCA